MYFAVVKLVFEEDASPKGDRKDLHTLVEKLRARFKVCAAAIDERSGDTPLAIAITALGSSEARLTQTLDAITEFCETAGIGRLESEQALLDHIDSLADMNEQE